MSRSMCRLLQDDGRSKATFNLAAPFFRVRSATAERQRSQRIFPSAQRRQPPGPEASIRVPGHVPFDSDCRNSRRYLDPSRALAPQACDTPTPGHRRPRRAGPRRARAAAGASRRGPDGLPPVARGPAAPGRAARTTSSRRRQLRVRGFKSGSAQSATAWGRDGPPPLTASAKSAHR
jgi:hypothetical protein